MVYLFVYGLLKRGKPLNYMLKEGYYKGKATIDGFNLYNCSNLPVMILGDGVVKGEVYKFESSIFKKMVKELDRVEAGYTRCLERIKMESRKPLNAFVYVYNYHPEFCQLIKDGEFK